MAEVYKCDRCGAYMDECPTRDQDGSTRLYSVKEDGFVFSYGWGRELTSEEREKDAKDQADDMSPFAALMRQPKEREAVRADLCQPCIVDLTRIFAERLALAEVQS